MIELKELVEKKAEQSYVNELVSNIESKANIATVTKLQNDVQALHNTLNSLSDSATITAINNQINYLNTEIQRRLTIDDLNSIVSNTTDISNRVDANASRIDNIETNLSNKASVTYVQRNVNELNNVITNVAAAVKTKADKSDVMRKASQSDLNALVKDVNELKEANGLTSNALSIGQVLKIPTEIEEPTVDTNTYIVKKGDNLYSIEVSALKYPQRLEPRESKQISQSFN